MGATVYSLPYLTVCRYTGVQPKEQTPKQRNIEYSHTDFFKDLSDDIAKHIEKDENP